MTETLKHKADSSEKDVCCALYTLLAKLCQQWKEFPAILDLVLND